MKIKFQMTKSPSKTFMGYHRQDAWQHYIFIGRCFERSDNTIRAWQISVFCFHLSFWWKSTPEDHMAFDKEQRDGPQYPNPEEIKAAGDEATPSAAKSPT